jgi:hypothetical protein
MRVQVGDAHANVQRLVSVVKMTTVLEECTTEEQRSVVRFLRARGLNAKDIHKDFSCLRWCLSLKAVHNQVEKFSQGRSKVSDDARPGAEVAETTVKRLLCYGFRHVGSNSTCFTFYFHLWPIYWLSLLYCHVMEWLSTGFWIGDWIY